MNQKSGQEAKNSIQKDFYKFWAILILVMIAEII